MKALLVFDCFKSNRVASVLIEPASVRMHTLQMEDEIYVKSICRLRFDEKTRKEKVILFDYFTDSLLEFELS